MKKEQNDKDSVHVPVLLTEVLDVLNPREGGIYVDGTLGGGGHSEALGRIVGPNGRIISFDRDLAAVDRTERRLREVFGDDSGSERFPFRFVHADYRYFEEALDMLEIDRIDGVLVDLGLSSDQLADRRRGFSFESEGELDLRFDTSEGETAAELLARWDEEEIANMIFRYGEERFSRRIARRIVQRRETGQPVRNAGDLADLVRSCVPKEKKTHFANKDSKRGKRSVAIDPATRTFQALRIAVNDELGALDDLLKSVPRRLKPGGVLAVISFHSLEDRSVKHAFRENDCWEILTKKPISASDEEIERNPRARSAKLRAARMKDHKESGR